MSRRDYFKTRSYFFEFFKFPANRTRRKAVNHIKFMKNLDNKKNTDEENSDYILERGRE